MWSQRQGGCHAEVVAKAGLTVTIINAEKIMQEAITFEGDMGQYDYYKSIMC